MWTETYHRFADEAAFLVACDGAGWSSGRTVGHHHRRVWCSTSSDQRWSHRRSSGTLITPGAVDPRGLVNVAWFSGTAMPAASWLLK